MMMRARGWCVAAVLMLSRLVAGMEMYGAEPSMVVDSCHTTTEAIHLFAGHHLAPIEGVWELAEDGAVLAIAANEGTLRHVTSDYSIIYVSGPDLSIPRGTVIGHAVQGSSLNIYDAVIYGEIAVDGQGHPSLSHPRTFSLTITADDRLALQHYHRGVKVNPWRFLPYLLRRGVSNVNERPRNLDGMARIYPQSSHIPVCL